MTRQELEQFTHEVLDDHSSKKRMASALLAVLDMPDNIDPRESPKNIVLSFKAGYNAALSDVRKKIWKA